MNGSVVVPYSLEENIEEQCNLLRAFVEPMQLAHQELTARYFSSNEELREAIRGRRILQNQLDAMKLQNQALRDHAKRISIDAQAELVDHSASLKHSWKVSQSWDTIHTGKIHSVDHSSRYPEVVTASWDGSLAVCDAETGDLLKRLQTDNTSGYYDAKFLESSRAKEKRIASAGASNVIHIWDYETGEVVSTLQGHHGEVNGLAVHTEQSVLCSCGDDNQAIVWDYRDGIVLRNLRTHSAAVYSATFLGREFEYCVATTCFDQHTRLFDMRTRQVLRDLQGHANHIIGLAFSNKYLATGSDDGTVLVYDIRRWDVLTVFQTADYCYQPFHVPTYERGPDYRFTNITANGGLEVKRLAFNESGSSLGFGGGNRVFIVPTSSFGGDPGKPFNDGLQLVGHQDCVFDVSFSQNAEGKAVLLSAGHDVCVKVWCESE